MPRRDELIARVRDMARQVREHQHPSGQDYFCLNLVAVIGESADGILEHVDELQVIADRAREFCEALQASTDDGEDERCIDAGHALWLAVMGPDVNDAVFVPETNHE